MRVQRAVVECDGCGFTTEPEDTLRAAVAQARATGWRLGKRRDECTACRPAMAGEDGPVPAGLAARLRTIGSCRCWCGQPGQHDWPGKVAGAPHPR